MVQVFTSLHTVSSLHLPLAGHVWERRRKMIPVHTPSVGVPFVVPGPLLGGM